MSFSRRFVGTVSTLSFLDRFYSATWVASRVILRLGPAALTAGMIYVLTFAPAWRPAAEYVGASVLAAAMSFGLSHVLWRTEARFALGTMAATRAVTIVSGTIAFSVGVSYLILVAPHWWRAAEYLATFVLAWIVFLVVLPALAVGKHLIFREAARLFLLNAEEMVAKRDVQGLIKALNHPWGLSNLAAVAEALGELGDAQAVEPLCAAIKSQHSIMRRTAAEALGRIGDARAVEPLCDALERGYWDVIRVAAEALGKIGDARAVESLCAALKDGNNEWKSMSWRVVDGRGFGDKQVAIIEALGKFADRRAVEPLCAALQIKDGRVRVEAVGALAKIGASAVRSLCAAYREADYDMRVRELARKALCKIGDARVAEALCAVLKDGDEKVRVEAALALADIGAPAVVPLCASLKDGDQGVRLQAVKVLGKIGDPRAVEPLCLALRHGVSDVRGQAAMALGKIGDPGAIEPLCAALEDKESGVRLQAAMALGKIGDPRAAEPLCAALEDRESGVRLAAAMALGEIGDPRAAEPLCAALISSRRKEAAEVLVRLYRHGSLDDGHKRLILAERGKITERHHDYFSRFCGGPHTDTGIGIDFPI